MTMPPPARLVAAVAAVHTRARTGVQRALRRGRGVRTMKREPAFVALSRDHHLALYLT